jgi:hypothetical protein
MSDLLGVFNDAEGPFDETGTGWPVGWVGQCGMGFRTLTQHHLGREPVEHALPAAVVGRIEAAQHDLQVGVVVVRDTQHIPLDATVEALAWRMVFGV